MYFSYGDERFYFNDSKIVLGLFSYRKGWLLYTPLMFLSIFGLMIGKVDWFKKYRIGILTLMSLIIFITFSWWSWFYGGSFGCRPLIDFYALFAISIAAFLTYLFKQKKAVKLASFAIISILIVFSLFQNLQYKNGLIHYSDMTKEAYWMHFLETKPQPGFYESLDNIDNDALQKGERDI